MSATTALSDWPETRAMTEPDRIHVSYSNAGVSDFSGCQIVVTLDGKEGLRHNGAVLNKTGRPKE